MVKCMVKGNFILKMVNIEKDYGILEEEWNGPLNLLTLDLY
jgi:hypothetical protein